MPASMSEIKRRIAGTAQIQRVTSTLRKVAAAKLAQHQRRQMNADHHRQRLAQVLRQAYEARPEGDDPHPLQQAPPPDGRPMALLVLGADRGLCGAFNSLLLNRAASFIGQQGHLPVRVWVRGRATAHRAVRRGISPLEPMPADDDLAEAMMAGFLEGRIGPVMIVYWSFKSRTRQDIALRRLLPVDLDADLPEADSDETGWATVEPSPAALLASLLPLYVHTALADATHQSAAAEHAQRQVAMSRASENAGEMLTDLRRRYSRIRQDSITGEMIELGAGMFR